MKEKGFLAAVILITGFTLSVLYYGYGTDVFSIFLRWVEIITVLSFFAGLTKVFKREILKIKEKKKNAWTSIVILISFAMTFFAGIMNLNQSRYTFNNIVREQPAFLAETTEILIQDDYYLARFPAGKKLALIVSGRVSSYFFPTDEMLKDADLSEKDFQALRYEKSSFLKDKIVFINEDDAENIKTLEKKVKESALEVISIMLPVSNDLKDWFINSINRLDDENIAENGFEKVSISDLQFNDKVINGTGLELKKGIIEYLGKKEITVINKEELVLAYNEFIDKSHIPEIVADKYSSQIETGISKDAAKKIAISFLNTGVTSSPKMKGFIRWIYRSIYDPLFSTFMAQLLFSMIITVYNKFSFRNYSYSVISITVCFIILGFIPYSSYFLSSYLPTGWAGPFSDGWLINVFSVPVFKVFAIGTGTGVLFFIFESVYDSFFSGKRGVK